MSRVVELHQGWMSDPAFRQEFAKLEEELKQLKALAKGRGGRSSAGKDGQAQKGATTDADRTPARLMSA